MGQFLTCINDHKATITNLYTIIKPLAFIIFFCLLIHREKIYFDKLDELFGFELNKENLNDLEWDPGDVFLYCIPAFLVILVCLAVILWFDIKWVRNSGSSGDCMKNTRKSAGHWM